MALHYVPFFKHVEQHATGCCDIQILSVPVGDINPCSAIFCIEVELITKTVSVSRKNVTKTSSPRTS